MTGMDTQLAWVKFQALIYKMERYLNIFLMLSLFFFSASYIIDLRLNLYNLRKNFSLEFLTHLIYFFIINL